MKPFIAAGLTTKSYLTKSLLKQIFEDVKVDNKFIADQIIEGYLIKHFSYYKPTIKLLAKLNIIPNKIEIKDFTTLAKKTMFTMRDIMEIFDCTKDVAHLILAKYFQKKWNFYYRKSELIDFLAEGVKEIGI